MFPLVPALRSTGSATGWPALFGSFVAHMAKSDFSYPYITGYGSSPSPCGPEAVRPLLVGHEISRFPHKERPQMPGSSTALGRMGARNSAHVHFAFRHQNSVSTQENADFAAQWLAYALPSMAGLCTPPADASPMSSRTPAHGSGPMWFATPSS
jgi:hypothetical protein